MSVLYKLEKPSINKLNKEAVLFAFNGEKKAEVFDFVKKSSEPQYLYWDKIKYLEPSPKDISKELLWMVIKVIREYQYIKSPIKDKEGNFFNWSKLKYFEEFFHELDMNTGGEIFVEKAGINKVNKQKIVLRGIMDEAIASSQLEGAVTSRQAAKKMLREGRKPVNSSEQMIVNNYQTMKELEEKYKDSKMSLSLLLELHSMITKNTLDSQGEVPHLRLADEPVEVVSKSIEGLIYYEAPSVDFVNLELQRLVSFANDESDNQSFIHPVIKAIMLHFWIGYLHPFSDGNGRLARLLFYWYLIKNGYWAFVYLPISKIIKQSPKQYAMAYVYSEQDDNDLTYFLDYNIGKIKVALQEFKTYLKQLSKGNLKMKSMSDAKYKLNIRQIQLLQYLYGDSGERTSATAHMNVNQITRMTAIKDLKDLKKRGFLLEKKQGKYVYYYGTNKIHELF